MKIEINGELFDYEFDINHVPMSEALAIERLGGRRYVEWEMGLTGGSAESVAVLACLVWQRDGRDVKLQDILDGKVTLGFTETYNSVMRALVEQQKAAGAAENPTPGAVPLTAPAGTDSM